jgi:hypothetical protein
MNYKIICNKRKKEYKLQEVNTKQIIKIFNKKCDAKTLMKKLNLGAGFDGQTPSFFLIKTQIV